MGALLPRRMSTEPAPSSPESSDSRKRRSLLALQRADRELGPEADEAHELLRDWELVDVAR